MAESTNGAVKAGGGEQRVALPVTHVTCLEDRAQVERRGELLLAQGLQHLRVEGVSPVAVDRSLKVELQGATLVDARVERRWKVKPQGGLAADASALRRRVHEHEQAAAALSGDISAKTAWLELARAAREDLLRAISEWVGAGKTDVDGWRAQLERVRDEEAKGQEELRRLNVEQAQLAKRLAEARQALAASEQPEAELAPALLLAVDSPAGVS